MRGRGVKSGRMIVNGHRTEVYRDGQWVDAYYDEGLVTGPDVKSVMQAIRDLFARRQPFPRSAPSVQPKK